jgi:hypothetical protein
LPGNPGYLRTTLQKYKVSRKNENHRTTADRMNQRPCRFLLRHDWIRNIFA